MRRALVVIHRWFGLFTALFLLFAGVTGAIIAWDHELDAWLNPQLFVAKSGRAGARHPLALADALEQRDPRLLVRYLPLHVEPGRTLMMSVAPRPAPSKARAALDFDQVAIDPATGEVQGARIWGEPSLARENLLPFLYRLHYTLHLPDALNLELGRLLMGLVALTWLLDAFVAIVISFPRRKSWRRSFAYRLREGGYRLQFDLHRSTGVWLWPLLALFAFTAVCLNLGREVARPLVSSFSELAPDPFASEQTTTIAPALSRRAAIEAATAEARRRQIAADAGGIFYASHVGLYGVGFFAPGQEHADGSAGNPWIYVDARWGRVVGAEIPGAGSLGDRLLRLQFPLHSGRIAGLFGRIFVSLLGLIIATVSVTGLLIWAKKRRARALSRERVARLSAAAEPLAAPQEQRG